MQDIQTNCAVDDPAPEQISGRDATRLVRKLRWIGMEAEANELQVFLRMVPAAETSSYLAEPIARIRPPR
jgi:hypothetical protein